MFKGWYLGARGWMGVDALLIPKPCLVHALLAPHSYILSQWHMYNAQAARSEARIQEKAI